MRAAAGILSLCFLLCTGCGVQETASDAGVYDRSAIGMNTVIELRVYAEDADAAEAALDAAEDEIARLESIFSTEHADSETARLNRSGTAVLSEDMQALMEASLALFADTDGAFDVTVYPLAKLWGFSDYADTIAKGIGAAESSASGIGAAESSASGGSAAESSASGGSAAESSIFGNAAAENSASYVPPTQAEIEAALALVGSEGIEYDSTTGTVTLPDGAAVDFGGIAKGYAASKIMDIYRTYGVIGGMASLGGNVEVTGTKTDGSPWKIGIVDPADTGSAMAVLTVTEDLAVVTSGGYRRFYTDADGHTYQHILDPSTGYPADNGLLSVTIVCRDGTMADGLSTALYVMGEEKAVAYWGAHADEFDCILLTGDGRLLVTDGIYEETEVKRYTAERIMP